MPWVVPDNISVLYLPPYSPELNPVERLWGYLRSHYLSNRAYEGYEDLFDAAGDGYRLKSVCACPYLEHEVRARSVLHPPSPAIPQRPDWRQALRHTRCISVVVRHDNHTLHNGHAVCATSYELSKSHISLT